jgi:hypothetical protein
MMVMVQVLPFLSLLEIQGDLDAMTQNWIEDECESRRRLVHFRQWHLGRTITTMFQPVSVDDSEEYLH